MLARHLSLRPSPGSFAELYHVTEHNGAEEGAMHVKVTGHHHPAWLTAAGECLGRLSRLGQGPPLCLQT